MNTIGLSIYAVNVIEEETKTNKTLQNKKGEIDFISLVEEFAKSIKNFDDDTNSETVFKFEKIERGEECNKNGQVIYSYINGLVKTGEYGVESELIDKKTGKLTHKRTTDEADVIPFAFLIAIPEGEINKGLAIFQTEGKYGMKSSFERRLNKYIRNKYKNLKFFLGAIIPIIYVEKILKKGVLKEIKAIRYDVPEEIVKKMNKNQGVDFYEERIFHNPTSFLRDSIEKIKECIRGQISYSKILELEDYNYDKLKLVFSNGKRKKTIDMTNIEKINIVEDITEEVGKEKGHPDFEKLKEQMKITARDYLEDAGFIEEG